jgi:hypothetical protein
MADAKDLKTDDQLATVSTVVRRVEILPPHALARTRVREASVTLPRLRFLDVDDGT